MAMVLLDPIPVQQWLDEHHGGERMIAFTRVMTPVNAEVALDVGDASSSVGSTAATSRLLGLDPEQRSWLLSRKAGLLLVTATNFYVLRLGGLKERIKETVYEAPRSQMQFVAHDLTIDRLGWRHWMVSGFPDGRYLLEPQILAKKGTPTKIAAGSDAFLTSLGDGVQHLGKLP